ncbi:bifunctional 3,4-dihydroxy-2-butanone-4-phosphate synthase/GTP cyclohydrolase II [Immundisolibacter sp.]|uniref:bifunctional 3,4-dihydroxy-2-butanone-4-phosphate synthase/GTP cyclohydrolase II n=1 Tax=Immundisolibacter sp. TaxID=1934948 RepID=UPI0019866F32|nr:3,4-dihydroxy-2-butanone-4-phosphate synthase [Immundisolibacter sp.]
MHLNSTEEIIADIRAGKMVILMDDADRENEGDLILAGECVTPEAINFMARYGRGLICLTLTEARCRQLNLPLMVADNNDKNTTNFTVSIEAASGVTTGISAADRAVTVQAAVRPDARPNDIVMPGHIFPLRAQPGGVLTRAGHTEAGCDLARLAGFEPSAVIVEILNEDGTMARYPQLVEFARTHGLKIGTIADLIRYRVEQEGSVEWVAESTFESEFGSFRLVAFHENDHGEVHLALVMGDIRRDEPTLARVQQASVLRDILGAQAPNRWSVRRALATIADAGRGVLVLLSPTDLPQTLLGEVQAYKMRHLGVPLPGLDPNPELRMYGVGAQILAQLGVGRMRIMGKPRKLHGLAGFGLELVDFVPPEAAREE